MSLTIDLPPSIERSLHSAAAEQGIPAEELVRQWIEHRLEGRTSDQLQKPEALSPEEWLQRADRWIETHKNWPTLDASANDRASYYE